MSTDEKTNIETLIPQDSARKENQLALPQFYIHHSK